MKVIKPSYEIMSPINGDIILNHIEKCGRICYKSEEKITTDSAKSFVKMLIERGHEAMIEHYSFTVKFIVDRGVSHELVRHRVASFAQESTRYCNYSKDKFGGEITFVQPIFYEGCESYNEWHYAMQVAENMYFALLENSTPQEARTVLPNSLKTEIVITANLREWRHILKLRTSKEAHPQMREVMIPLLYQLKTLIPVVFDDIII